MTRYMRATPRTICLLFANVSPPRSCFHGDMIVANSTVARARRTGVVQRSSTAGTLGPRRPSLMAAGGTRGAGTPQRRSSVSALPTAFENAENNTAKGRKVSIVDLMIAAKREAEEAEESDDDQSRGPSRGPRRGRLTRKKSIFDIFPDDHDGEPEKPSKGKKKPKNAVKKSTTSRKLAPRPKMNPPTKTATGGAVCFLKCKINCNST